MIVQVTMGHKNVNVDFCVYLRSHGAYLGILQTGADMHDIAVFDDIVFAL